MRTKLQESYLTGEMFNAMQEAADVLGEMEEMREKLAGEMKLRVAAGEHCTAIEQELREARLQVCPSAGELPGPICPSMRQLKMGSEDANLSAAAGQECQALKGPAVLPHAKVVKVIMTARMFVISSSAGVG